MKRIQHCSLAMKELLEQKKDYCKVIFGQIWRTKSVSTLLPASAASPAEQLTDPAPPSSLLCHSARL